MGATLLGRRVTAESVFNALCTLRAANYDGSFPEYSLARRTLALQGGVGRPNAVDLYAECGYEPDPYAPYYYGLYARGGVSTRVVDIWPDECWAAYPELYQTEEKRVTKFERAWADLAERVLPWHYLHRADRMSGIGHFGILLLGVADGKPLSEPVEGVHPDTGVPSTEWDKPREPTPKKLLYLRAFDESMVRVDQWEKDWSSPRYMQPKTYSVTFPSVDSTGPGTEAGRTNQAQATVHWTRVIHLADNRGSSEVWGVPRMRPVLNLIHDIHKVQGGSAEMFWKGGFPGYAFEAFPNELNLEPPDLDNIRREVDAYTRGLQRFLTSQGGSWKSLAMQVANPKNHLEVYVGIMCATIGVPISIFMGREAGHLAGTQDTGNWKDRLRGRQVNYLEPMVVKPFVSRLMGIGCLPRAPGFLLSWRDLRALSDKDRADVALKQVQTLMQYVSGGCNQLVPEHMLLTMVMGFTEAQAAAIQAELKANPPKQLAPPSGGDQAGGRDGNASKKKNGRPPDGPPEGEVKSKPVTSNSFSSRTRGVL